MVMLQEERLLCLQHRLTVCKAFDPLSFFHDLGGTSSEHMPCDGIRSLSLLASSTETRKNQRGWMKVVGHCRSLQNHLGWPPQL